MGTYTRFLYADPTILAGAGSLVDFGNFLHEFNASETTSQADFLATKSDWLQVYEDLFTASNQFLQRHPECRNVHAGKTAGSSKAR